MMTHPTSNRQANPRLLSPPLFVEHSSCLVFYIHIECFNRCTLDVQRVNITSDEEKIQTLHSYSFDIISSPCPLALPGGSYRLMFSVRGLSEESDRVVLKSIVIKNGTCANIGKWQQKFFRNAL